MESDLPPSLAEGRRSRRRRRSSPCRRSRASARPRSGCRRRRRRAGRGGLLMSKNTLHVVSAAATADACRPGRGDEKGGSDQPQDGESDEGAVLQHAVRVRTPGEITKSRGSTLAVRPGSSTRVPHGGAVPGLREERLRAGHDRLRSRRETPASSRRPRMSEFTLTYPGGSLPLGVTSHATGRPVWTSSSLLSATGHVTLDAGFKNTASCASAITYIDGDAGILRYRGYPIEQLAGQRVVHRGVLPAHLWRAPDRRPSWPRSRTRSAGTRCCTRTCAGSSTASPATRTRWRCCPRRSARCRRSTRTASTRSTASRSRSRPSGCWPRCRPSRPTPTRSPSASRSSTRTTRWATSTTSCG